MHAMTVTDGRAQLAEVIDRARISGEPVVLTRHGKPVAAVIDHARLEALIAAAEDLADIRAAQDARDEMRRTGAEPIPWDEVKADLGLT